MEFVTNEVESRKLRSPTPIPWASFSQPTGQGYPAWLEPKRLFSSGLNRKFQLIELNEYPSASVDPVYPSYLEPRKFFNKGLNRKLQLVELDSFPETPAGFLSGFYPGSALAKSNRITFKNNLLSPLEIDTYPLAPAPEQPLTAFMLPVQYRRHKRSALQKILEINSYPETPDIPTPALWTAQADVTTTWTAQNDVSTTWTEQ